MSVKTNNLTEKQLTRLQELMDEADFEAMPRGPNGPFDITVTFKTPEHYTEMVEIIRASQPRYSIGMSDMRVSEAIEGYTLRGVEPST